MIVYAIHSFLVSELDGILTEDQIIVAPMDINESEEALYLRDMGGETRGYPDFRSDALIQITAVARDDWRAREIANLPFNLIREKFMDTFTFETTNYLVSKIGAIQRPTPLGTTNKGLYIYTNNYQVVFSEQPQEVTT
jgi:hypothetical protein